MPIYREIDNDIYTSVMYLLSLKVCVEGMSHLNNRSMFSFIRMSGGVWFVYKDRLFWEVENKLVLFFFLFGRIKIAENGDWLERKILKKKMHEYK